MTCAGMEHKISTKVRSGEAEALRRVLTASKDTTTTEVRYFWSVRRGPESTNILTYGDILHCPALHEGQRYFAGLFYLAVKYDDGRIYAIVHKCKQVLTVRNFYEPGTDQVYIPHDIRTLKLIRMRPTVRRAGWYHVCNDFCTLAPDKSVKHTESPSTGGYFFVQARSTGYPPRSA